MQAAKRFVRATFNYSADNRQHIFAVPCGAQKLSFRARLSAVFTSHKLLLGLHLRRAVKTLNKRLSRFVSIANT